MRESFRRDPGHALFAGLFVVYAFVQAACLWRVLHYFPAGFETEGYYWPLARFIAADGWSGALPYLRGEVPPEIAFGPTFRPPLYSFALAALISVFGEHEAVALAFNNVVIACAVLIVRRLGSMLGSLPGFVAPALVMLDPLYLTTANASQSDALFTALLLAFVLLMARALDAEPSPRRAVLASLALAAAVLTRNAGLYMGIAALAALSLGLFRGVRLWPLGATLAAFLVVQAVPIGAWMARNYAVTGNPDFAGGSTGAYLIGYFAPQVVARRDGISYGEAKQQLMARFSGDGALAALPRGEQERRQVAEATRIARENPALVLRVAAENTPKLFLSYSAHTLAVFLDRPAFDAWSRFEAGEFNQVYEASFSSLERKLATFRAYLDVGAVWPLAYGVAHKAMNGSALLLGLTGVVLMCLSGDRRLLALGAFFALYVVAMTGIISLVPAARFRLPVTPVLYVAAGWAAGELWRRFGLRRMAGTPA